MLLMKQTPRALSVVRAKAGLRLRRELFQLMAQSSSNSRSALECTPKEVAAMIKEIEALFAFGERAVVHNFYKCSILHRVL